jgi:hypothetical protein
MGQARMGSRRDRPHAVDRPPSRNANRSTWVTTAVPGWTYARWDGQSRSMPSWLRWLLFIIFILVFIIPNPVQAGVFFGDLINSIVVFFRSFGAAVGV